MDHSENIELKGKNSFIQMTKINKYISPGSLEKEKKILCVVFQFQQFQRSKTILKTL